VGTALFLVITQRAIVISYRRFETSYRSLFQRSRIWILEPWVSHWFSWNFGNRSPFLAA